MPRIGERTRLACLFESLAVASRPLQRRPRRNNLLFHHEAHEGHGDFESGKEKPRKWDFQDRLTDIKRR